MSTPSTLAVDQLTPTDGSVVIQVKDIQTTAQVVVTKDVKYYGAVGDGVTDDTAAVQAAADTGSLYFPPGTYKITSPITITSTTDCVVKGSSRSDTAILFTGAGTLFSAVFTDSIRFVQVHDIRVLTDSLAVNTAFYFEWPEDFEHGLVQRGSFSNVSIRGVDEYEEGFDVCVHMHQGDNINFVDCEFKGAGGSTTVTQAYNTRCSTGVKITGRFSPVEYRFIGCYFGSFVTGINVGDTAEGIYVSDCIIIACQTGIYWVTGNWSTSWPGTPGASASGRPLLSVTNTHFNYYQFGIYTSGVVSIHESDLLLYHNDNGTQNGIALAHGNGTEVFINNVETWGFNTSYYTDGVVFYEFITYASVLNVRGVCAGANAYRYVVENRSGCTNNFFRDITRRVTGGNFTTTTMINDLSGGLIDVGVRGTLVYSVGDQSVPSGPETVVNYGARTYDATGLWPGSGGSLTVPAGTHNIRLSGGVSLSAASAVNVVELAFRINGAEFQGGGWSGATTVAGKASHLTCVSAVRGVNPGDVITMVVRHDDGVNRTITSGSAWMQVELIN